MSFYCGTLETCGQDVIDKVLTNHIHEPRPAAVFINRPKGTQPHLSAYVHYGCCH